MVNLAGKLSTPLLLGALVGALSLQNQACSSEQDAEGFSDEAKKQLVLDTLDLVLMPQLEIIQEEIGRLEQLLITLQAQPNDLERQAAAEDGWIRLMTEWQVAESMQLGTFASSFDSALGSDVRDEIYSWPTVNSCRIDQETVLGDWGAEAFFEENLVNVYGLDAIEHLLFSDLATVCPSQVAPVSDGSWDALGEEGVRDNRLSYALALLQKVDQQIDSQLKSLSSYEEQFSVEQRFQDRFTALFYLETMTKDRKLGHVMGGQDCAADLCVEDMEGVLSDRSLFWLQSNLSGFRQLFTAGEGRGFDSLLQEAGAPALASSIVEQLDIVEMELNKLVSDYDGSLRAAVEEEPERVQQVYDELSIVSTMLRVDVAVMFHLDIPTEVAGDND